MAERISMTKMQFASQSSSSRRHQPLLLVVKSAYFCLLFTMLLLCSSVAFAQGPQSYQPRGGVQPLLESVTYIEEKPRQLQENMTKTSGETGSRSGNATEAPRQNQNATATAPASDANATTGSESSTTTTTTAAPTNAPTLPIGSVEMPASVDILECHKHLAAADSDRNNFLYEQEFVTFVREIVSHDFYLALSNIPGNSQQVWGNTVTDLPAGVQAVYKNLNQGGAINIRGYKPEEALDISLQQLKFLTKVCVHTEASVYQVLQQDDPTTDTSSQANSIPTVETVSVNTSFAFTNTANIRATNLEVGHESRIELELAYQALVLQVVGDTLGTTLMAPVLSEKTATGRQDRNGRQLTVALDPRLPEIYKINDVLCKGEEPDLAESLKTDWCLEGCAHFTMFVVGEDPDAVAEKYSQAVQDATENGDFETAFKEIAPNSLLVITGTASGTVPPPETEAPTQAPATRAPSPEVDITVPEAPNATEDGGGNNETVLPRAGGTGGPDLTLILTLAGALFLINACVIGISLFMCWRNKQSGPILMDDDDGSDIVDPYYGPASKSRDIAYDSDESDSDDERVSNPPTMEDIEEANRMPAAAPAPAPAPVLSLAEQDAKERERILAGDKAATSEPDTSAPTMEEIAMAMGTSGSSGLAPPSQRSLAPNAHGNDDDDGKPPQDTIQPAEPAQFKFAADAAAVSAGYEEDKLPVDDGELA